MHFSDSIRVSAITSICFKQFTNAKFKSVSTLVTRSYVTSSIKHILQVYEKFKGKLTTKHDMYVAQCEMDNKLTLKAPITTKVVCFSRLLKCLRSLCGKQCGPRSDCSYRSSLFWIQAVCFYT